MMNEQPIISSSNDFGVINLEVPTPFPIGNVNSYLLLGDKITLVDTGPKTERAWKTLIYQLNKNGLRIKDLDQVIITHHHVDHCGLLALLLEHHPDLKLLAHKLTIPWLEKRADIFSGILDFYEELYLQHGLSLEEIGKIKKFHKYFDQFLDPVQITDELVDREYLDGHSGWQVIHNPGHTQGHISLYNANHQSLIAGDHLIDNVSSGTFIEPSLNRQQARPRSMVDYQASLRQIKTLEIKRVYSGHGIIITDPNGLIDQQLKRIEERLDMLSEVFRANQNSLSVYEIMKLVYPERYGQHLPLYFSEVLGWLDILEQQGRVGSKEKDGLIRYYFKE